MCVCIYLFEYPALVLYGTFTLIMQINFNLKDLLIEIHNKQITVNHYFLFQGILYPQRHVVVVVVLHIQPLLGRVDAHKHTSYLTSTLSHATVQTVGKIGEEKYDKFIFSSFNSIIVLLLVTVRFWRTRKMLPVAYTC